MIYAIFSDIHSNLEAYKAFLQDSKQESVERYYCVGDIVGYGADPQECIQLTKELDCPVVCGNHDWAVAERFDVNYLNRNAKEAVLWTRDILSDADKSYLKKLEPVYQEREFTLVHGTLEHPEEFDYIIDEMQAARTIHLQITQACFVGHSHVAGIFFDDKKGYIHYTTAPQVNMLDGHHYLINVGSIGQPRDGDWRASYCLYDTDKNILQIKRVEYDVRKASDKILKAGLPSQLAIRILSGR